MQSQGQSENETAVVYRTRTGPPAVPFSNCDRITFPPESITSESIHSLAGHKSEYHMHAIQMPSVKFCSFHTPLSLLRCRTQSAILMQSHWQSVHKRAREYRTRGGPIRHQRSSLRSVGDNSLLPNESNLLQFQPQGIILCITFRPYFNPHPSLQCTSPCQPIQKAEHYSQQRRRTAIYAITMQSEIPMQSRGQSVYERAREYRTSL